MSEQRIHVCLWFDDQAEAAAAFYTGIFKNSRMGRVLRYEEAGRETHQRPVGSVMAIDFELDGQHVMALNGGPLFQFNEAVSLVVNCKDQKEIDYYWEKLGAGGDPDAQQCGWLKDKFGVSWQVVPHDIGELIGGKATEAMMQMKKLDIAALERARGGKPGARAK